MNIKGLKVNFLGDSITEGIGVEDIENCRVDNRLKKLCDLAAVNNYSVSGTRSRMHSFKMDSCKVMFSDMYVQPLSFGMHIS